MDSDFLPRTNIYKLEVGRMDQNEDNDFIAKILSVEDGKESSWVTVAISDYMSEPAEKVPVANKRTAIEDTKLCERRSGRRIIKVSGPSLSTVETTLYAFCDYIRDCLAELKWDYGDENWCRFKANCIKEAAVSGDKTARQLFDLRRNKREMLRKRYFEEKGDAERAKKDANFYGYDYDDDFVLEEKEGCLGIKMEKGATVIDEDDHFVAKVMHMGKDGKWVELAISEFVTAEVEEQFDYPANQLASIKETGELYEEGRILRIASITPHLLAKSVNELCRLVRKRLAFLRRDLTPAERATMQHISSLVAKKKGGPETGDELYQQYCEAREKSVQRYNERRESNKKQGLETGYSVRNK